MDPSQPVALEELSRLCACARRGPPQDWERLDQEGISVHRRSEAAGEQRVVERGCCEFALDAPAPGALALLVDPEVRRSWDDVLGPSMERFTAQGHDFLSFRFEGLYGLVAKSFFVWSRTQAYDREGRECADAASAWTFATLWRHADVSCPGLPPATEKRDRSLQVGIVLDRDPEQPSARTRATVFARVKYQDTTGILQCVVTNVIQSVVVINSQKLFDAAASRRWEKAAGFSTEVAQKEPIWQRSPRRATLPSPARQAAQGSQSRRHTQPALAAAAAAPGAPPAWPVPPAAEAAAEAATAQPQSPCAALPLPEAPPLPPPATAPPLAAAQGPPPAAAQPPPGEAQAPLPAAQPPPAADDLGSLDGLGDAFARASRARASALLGKDPPPMLARDLAMAEPTPSRPSRRGSALETTLFRVGLKLEDAAQLRAAADSVGRLEGLQRRAPWRPAPARDGPLEGRLKSVVASWRSAEAAKARGAGADFDEAFRGCLRGEPREVGWPPPEAPTAAPPQRGRLAREQLSELRGTDQWLNTLLQDLASEQVLAPPWLPGKSDEGESAEAPKPRGSKIPTAWIDPKSEASALEAGAVWRALDQIAPPQPSMEAVQPAPPAAELREERGRRASSVDVRAAAERAAAGAGREAKEKAVASAGGRADGPEGAGAQASRKSLRSSRASATVPHAKRASASPPPPTRKSAAEEPKPEERGEEAKLAGEEKQEEEEEEEAGYFSAFGAAMYSAFAGGEEDEEQAAPEEKAETSLDAAEEGKDQQDQETRAEEAAQPAGEEEEDAGYFGAFGAAMFSAFGGGEEDEEAAADKAADEPQETAAKATSKMQGQQWGGGGASGGARARRAERRKQRGGGCQADAGADDAPG